MRFPTACRFYSRRHCYETSLASTASLLYMRVSNRPSQQRLVGFVPADAVLPELHTLKELVRLALILQPVEPRYQA